MVVAVYIILAICCLIFAFLISREKVRARRQMRAWKHREDLANLTYQINANGNSSDALKSLADKLSARAFDDRLLFKILIASLTMPDEVTKKSGRDFDKELSDKYGAENLDRVRGLLIAFSHIVLSADVGLQRQSEYIQYKTKVEPLLKESNDSRKKFAKKVRWNLVENFENEYAVC